MTGLTARLIEHARSITPASIPDDARRVAKTCVLDAIGCALAAQREPLVDILCREAIDEVASTRSTVIGRDLRTSAQWAALINGAAAHALDFDDTNFMLPEHPIHPTAPVLPAALALGEELRASGDALITAFIAGIETECRLGAVVGTSHYTAGWHSTATLGTFGSTAACAQLLGLGDDAWPHAFGIASTQAAGVKSVFGTMAKPLQTGRAAANGILAAKLASKGFTASVDPIEMSQGFADTHDATLDVQMLDDIGDEFMTLRTVFKYHASCYFTHSAIEAVRELKQDASRVRAVEVLVPAQHLDVCNIWEPSTSLEGKFSLRATVAMALLGDDTADPGAYTDDRMLAPDLTAMRDKVAVSACADLAGTQTRVEIRTESGDTHSTLVDVGVPASDVGAQWRSIASKFERLATPVLGEATVLRVERLVDELEALDDVRELLEACRASS